MLKLNNIGAPKGANRDIPGPAPARPVAGGTRARRLVPVVESRLGSKVARCP